MDAELHGAFSLTKLKARCVGCSLFVLSPPNLTQPWKILRASLGSTVALMGSIFLHPRPSRACAVPQADIRPPRRSTLPFTLCVVYLWSITITEKIDLTRSGPQA